MFTVTHAHDCRRTCTVGPADKNTSSSAIYAKPMLYGTHICVRMHGPARPRSQPARPARRWQWGRLAGFGSSKSRARRLPTTTGGVGGARRRRFKRRRPRGRRHYRWQPRHRHCRHSSSRSLLLTPDVVVSGVVVRHLAACCRDVSEQQVEDFSGRRCYRTWRRPVF
eukprot:COSAG05_NODE_152_length_15898_cov_21.995000_4_plen_167_part_00